MHGENKDLFSVRDRVVIVTGCARGIGLTYARGLGAHGAKLAICDIQDKEIAEKGRDLEAEGCEVMASGVDVTSREEIDAFVQQVLERFGRIDGLVNNAGVLLRRTPEEMTLEEWEDMKNHIQFDFIADNYFTELKEIEIRNERMNQVNTMDPYVGKYFYVEYMRRQVLKQTEEEIKEIDKQIEAAGLDWENN